MRANKEHDIKLCESCKEYFAAWCQIKKNSHQEQKWRHVSSLMEYRLLMHVCYTFLSLCVILNVPQLHLFCLKLSFLNLSLCIWRMKIIDRHRKYSVFIHLPYTNIFIDTVDGFMEQLNKHLLGIIGQIRRIKPCVE